MNTTLTKLVLAMAMATTLVACGSDNSSTDAKKTNAEKTSADKEKPSVSKHDNTKKPSAKVSMVTLKGVAATGKALKGKVQAVNNKGQTSKVVDVNQDGSFSLEVAQGAPYLVKGWSSDIKTASGKPLELFTFTSGGEEINLTTLTTQAVFIANNQKNLPELFKNWGNKGGALTQTDIDQAATNVIKNLGDAFVKVGIDKNTNVFTKRFTPNGKGLDAVLDTFKASYNCTGTPCSSTYTVDGKNYTWKFNQEDTGANSPSQADKAESVTGETGGSPADNTVVDNTPEIEVKITEKTLTQAQVKQGAVVATFTTKDRNNKAVTVALNIDSKKFFKIDGNKIVLTKAGAAYILKKYQFTRFSYAMSATNGKLFAAASGKLMVTNRTEPVIAKLFSDDFESGNLNKWQTISLSGNKDWVVESYGGNKFAVGNCYKGKGDCNDWMITPKLDLSQLTNPKLKFVTAWNYGRDSLKQLTIKVSSNYTGNAKDLNKATWVDITNKAKLSPGNFKFTESGDIDLKQFATKPVYIAFQYQSTVPKAAKWEVDSVMVFGEGTLGLGAKLNAPTSTTFSGRNYAFSATAENGAGDYTYKWDFGDGTIATTAKVNHTYTKTGTYQVKLTVTDRAGKSITQTKQITIAKPTTYPVPSKKGDFRIATFNVGLDRFSQAGAMKTELAKGSDKQAKKIAEIIQRTAPDVLLINEIDGNDSQATLNTFKQKYLEVSQNGAAAATYAHVYMSECNTGVPSGKDYDNNGKTNDPGDAYGFGNYPGQYCMAILSKYPLDTSKARTFQKFLWKDMPNALRPKNENGSQWYSDDEWSTFRLSSKTHIDLPIVIKGKTVHVLASHPTPPVFDGKEDRNGKRNFDEIRLWADYIDPAKGGYLYDDANKKVTLAKNTRFVIVGDENASSVEGDAAKSNGMTAIDQLLKSAMVNPTLSESVTNNNIPTSVAGAKNAPKSSYGKYHTAGWRMRADYVLPSAFGLKIAQSGVFWPQKSDDLYYLVNSVGRGDRSSSDHRMVWADLSLTNTTVNPVSSMSTVFFDDFETLSLSKWQVLNMGGTGGWKAEKYTNRKTKVTSKYAAGNCYKSKGNCDDWMLKTIDLTGKSDAALTFKSAWNYGKNASSQIKLKVSTDYSPSKPVTSATWNDLTAKATWSPGRFRFVDSGSVSLKAYAGKKVTIAYHYKTVVSGAAKWEIDDVKVTAK